MNHIPNWDIPVPMPGPVEGFEYPDNKEGYNAMLKELDTYTALLKNCVGGKPFLTYHRYVGLRPAEIRDTDVIYLFRGAPFPYIVRTLDKAERCMLLGDA